MTETGSLIEQLDKKLSKLNITDVAWRVFITDHIDVIKAASSEISITDETRDRYRYKFEHLMRDNSCHPSIIWIARLINDITMFEDFTTRSTLLIPGVTEINQLYRVFRTSTTLA